MPQKKNPNYYFDDGNITFLVDDELFRIHRHFLVRDSVVFRDMLQLPLCHGSTAEGLSDDSPIVLEGVKNIDFSRLLWIFYNSTYGEYTATAEEWMSILTLADMWQFMVIRSLAIEKLRNMVLGPIEKLELCHRFDIDDAWASEAYETLCSRSEPLSLCDALKIGIQNSVLIAQGREHRIKERIEERLISGKRHNATCDICNFMILGIRRKCIVCSDFDMCSYCFENYGDKHDKDHEFFSAIPWESNASTG